MSGDPRPSPLALTVLSLLEVEPLHPYAMQRLIRQWGKDKVVNVGQRANLYKTIRRLLDAGLITVLHTERDHQYPERTVYALTEVGRTVRHRWLVDMLARPRREFPEFPAALSFAMLLDPAGVAELLTQRADELRRELAAIDEDLRAAGAIPRVAVLETEYLRALTRAEVAWVDAVVAELRSGVLSWSYEELAEAAAPDNSG